MTSATPTSRPMTGLRVLDFTMMMAGPYCTRMMADLGAEVIKVEPPAGDPMRTSVPVRDGCSAYFGHLNAGKKSVVLDLKQPAERASALELAKTADVVVESFRPDVMSRMGLGYADIERVNPAVVYVSISGFGQRGPHAGRPAYAPIVHASSGLDLAIMGHQKAAAPPPTGIFTADVMAGLFGLIGAQSALAVRAASGRGQHVDVSLFEGILNLMPYEVQEAQCPQPPRPIYRALRSADGFVMLMALTEANFDNLCEAIDRPDLKRDERFSAPRPRAANRDALSDLVEAWTEQRTSDACEQHFAKHGVPCSRYRSVAQTLDDPQVVARGSYATVADAAGGYRVPNLPFLLDGARPQVRNDVPRLGEHAAEWATRAPQEAGR